MQKLDIPYAYAGMRLADLPDSLVLSRAHRADSDQEIIALGESEEAKEYRLVEGYLIPYYTPRKMDPEIRHRNIELIIDRAHKFFYMAEPSLDKLWSHKEIEDSRKAWLECDDSELKKVRGRILVGAIVNRMQRLAQLYLHGGDQEITKIDLSITQQYACIKAQTSSPLARQGLLEPVRKEFSEYYMFLVAGDGADAVSAVRFRDKSSDRDGILADIIREMGKPMLRQDEEQERFTRAGIVEKIGATCQSIDQLYEGIPAPTAHEGEQQEHAKRPGLKTLLQQPKLLRLMEHCRQEYGNMVLGQERESMPISRALVDRPYLEMMDEFVQLTRARACLRSEDAASFGHIQERLDLLEGHLHHIHSHFEQTAIERNRPDQERAHEIIERSMAAMLRAAEARTPIHQRAPGILSTLENDKTSSVARLHARILDWLETQQLHAKRHPRSSSRVQSGAGRNTG